MMDAGTIRLSVYERAGILTSACGSGACVTLLAACSLGLTNQRHARVDMAESSVQITLDDRNYATMVGSADCCFSGRLPSQEGRVAWMSR